MANPERLRMLLTKPGRVLLIVCLAGLLHACAPTQQQTAGPGDVPPPLAPSITITDLPCAETSPGDQINIVYATESLYRKGAVLPKVEGLACLEVLSDWLKTAPRTKWQVAVGGEAGYGFEPLAIAGKREELLQRFFTRKGVETSGWSWLSVADQDRQLQFTSLP